MLVLSLVYIVVLHFMYETYCFQAMHNVDNCFFFQNQAYNILFQSRA